MHQLLRYSCDNVMNEIEIFQLCNRIFLHRSPTMVVSHVQHLVSLFILLVSWPLPFTPPYPLLWMPSRSTSPKVFSIKALKILKHEHRVGWGEGWVSLTEIHQQRKLLWARWKKKNKLYLSKMLLVTGRSVPFILDNRWWSLKRSFGFFFFGV